MMLEQEQGINYAEKTQCTVFKVESESSDRTYEVKESNRYGYSCNCPAWTRRVGENGERHCKHVQAVKDYLVFQADPESNMKLRSRVVAMMI